MENLLILAQLIISISVIFVWVFRRDNITTEFKHFGISDLLQNIVGALKLSLATILILGIWYSELLFFSSLSMAFLMICAQYYHIKVKNPWHKFIPSFSLLVLCLFIAISKYGIL